MLLAPVVVCLFVCLFFASLPFITKETQCPGYKCLRKSYIGVLYAKSKIIIEELLIFASPNLGLLV